MIYLIIDELKKQIKVRIFVKFIKNKITIIISKSIEIIK